jgi:hypothetical protein
MGDLLISCAGGAPGGVVGGNLTVFLDVNVTNKLINNFTDVQMTVDNGSGPVAANVAAQPFGANGVVLGAEKGVPLKFDESKLTGALNRMPNLERAKRVLGWSPSTAFSKGLQETFDWARARLGNRGDQS